MHPSAPRFLPTSMPAPEAIDAYNVSLRPYWHPVYPADHLLDNQPVAVELLSEPLVIARLNGELVAMQDLCRHFQAQLSLGTVEEVGEHGACLRCPYHGWAYAADGRCVDIPQLAPGRSIPSQARVPSYAVREYAGLIWVSLDANPRFDLPELPELNDPAFRVGRLRCYEPWSASAPRIVLAALDDTHFPWVHPGVLGDRSHVAPPDHKVWREGQQLLTQYTIQQPANMSVATSKNTAAMQDVTYTNYLSMPTTIRLVKDSDDGRRYVIWLTTSPRRYNLTDTYWRVARNYDLDPERDEEYERFEDMVRAQDRPIVESQRPWLLPPFWSKLELPLRPADLPLIEYHRWLDELGITIAL